jgi:hypothetical protein
MFNVNGPPRGFNVTNDQASYDLVYRDIIISNTLGTNNNSVFTYNLGTDSVNQIYKAELISATVKFNSAIPSNVQNKAIILNIPQLNGNTCKIAGNNTNVNTATNQTYNPTTGKYDPVTVNAVTSGQGNNVVQSAVFCQIPDNNTPITSGSVTSNNIISLLIGPHMYDSIQYYNPPISKLNTINVSWYDLVANQILIDPSTSGAINSFYFTLRLHYFQKRNSTTSFSTSVFTNADTGTLDSIFQPKNRY